MGQWFFLQIWNWNVIEYSQSLGCHLFSNVFHCQIEVILRQLMKYLWVFPDLFFRSHQKLGSVSLGHWATCTKPCIPLKYLERLLHSNPKHASSKITILFSGRYHELFEYFLFGKFGLISGISAPVSSRCTFLPMLSPRLKEIECGFGLEFQSHSLVRESKSHSISWELIWHSRYPPFRFWSECLSKVWDSYSLDLLDEPSIKALGEELFWL